MFHGILTLLNARGSGPWHARCPCRNNHKNGDSRPSVRLWMGDKGLMVRCYRGCRFPEIAAAIGTEQSEWFKEQINREVRRPMTKVIASYDYVDEHGEVLYTKCRTEPKSFFFKRPGPEGGWVYSLAGGTYARHGDSWRPSKGDEDGDRRTLYVEEAKPLLYRFPQLVGASMRQPIFVVEGEKDADLLASLGFVATTSGGTGSWKWHFGQHLTGRRVVIIPDRDDPGLELAHWIAASCLSWKCASVRMVEEGFAVPPGGDISDWLNIHHKAQPILWKQNVIDLIKKQEEWVRVPIGGDT